MIMASVPAVITIQSSDEEDEVVFLGETHASVQFPRFAVKREASNSDKENDSYECSIDSPPISQFKINKGKLESLRKMVDRSKDSRGVTYGSKNVLLKSKFKINKTRLKKLKAVVTIELGSCSPDKSRRTNAKEEKMDVGNSEFVNDLCFNQSPVHPQFPLTGIQSPTGYQSSLIRLTSSGSPEKRLTGSNPPARKLFQSGLLRSPKHSKSPSKLHPSIRVSPAKTKSQPSSNSQSVAGPQTPPKVSPASTNDTEPSTQATINSWLIRTPHKSNGITPRNDGSAKAVTAKRNEIVWPPSHVVLNPDKFTIKLYEHPKLFSTFYVDIVEALQDEQLFFASVRTMQSFMGSCTAPPSDLIWYLFNDVLLKSQNQRLSHATYSVLNEIHARYPGCCLAMDIQWSHVESLSEYLLSLIASATFTEIQFLNANLALSFLLGVLSSELKFTALKTKHTRVRKYFSADFDIRNMKDIIVGVKVCLCNHKDSCGSGTCSSGATQPGKLTAAKNGVCNLELFQTLLKFVIVSSTNKERVAIRIADELMYLYMELSTLQARVLLLQTLKSQLIRRYLIEVLLMNYCSLQPDALQGEVPMSIRKILYQDFRRVPPRRSVYNDGYWTVEEVEEYVTLVAYLLQSYIVTHSELQSYHGDFPLYKCDQFKKFTEEDLNLLQDLKAHASALQERCEGFLRDPGMLSLRTILLLDMVGMLV